MVDARVADVLTRVDTGEAGTMWGKLDELRRRFEDAQMKGRTRISANAVQDMMVLVGKGASDFAAWAEVIGLLEQRRKLVESERKRQVEMHQMVTVDKAMVLIDQLSDSVRGHVFANCDGDAARIILAGVQADILRAITVPAS